MFVVITRFVLVQVFGDAGQQPLGPGVIGVDVQGLAVGLGRGLGPLAALQRDAPQDARGRVVGVGGGSAIDAAKAFAALIPNEGNPLRYLEVVGDGAGRVAVFERVRRAAAEHV